MKGLEFLKDLGIIILALIFCAIFFAIYYPTYAVWYVYNAIKQHFNNRKHANQ